MATFKKPCSNQGRVYLLVKNKILYKLSLAKRQKLFPIDGGFQGNYPYLNDLRIWPKAGFYFKIKVRVPKSE